MPSAEATAMVCSHRELPPATDCPWCRLETMRKEIEALRLAVETRDVLVGTLQLSLRLSQGHHLRSEGGRQIAAAERDAALQVVEELRRKLDEATNPRPSATWTFDAGRGQRSEREELILLIDALRAAIRVLTKDLKDLKCPCGADAVSGAVSFHCFQHAPNGAFILDRKGGTA